MITQLFVACSCGLDPASETMIVQTGLAVALGAPFWFRSQIADGIRRLRGIPPAPDIECAERNEGESGS